SLRGWGAGRRMHRCTGRLRVRGGATPARPSGRSTAGPGRRPSPAAASRARAIRLSCGVRTSHVREYGGAVVACDSSERVRPRHGPLPPGAPRSAEGGGGRTAPVGSGGGGGHGDTAGARRPGDRPRPRLHRGGATLLWGGRGYPDPYIHASPGAWVAGVAVEEVTAIPLEPAHLAIVHDPVYIEAVRRFCEAGGATSTPTPMLRPGRGRRRWRRRGRGLRRWRG